jgi:hypothetical protein
MAALFFAFGLFAILCPEKLRAVLDNFSKGHGIRIECRYPFFDWSSEAWELAVRRFSCTSLTSALVGNRRNIPITPV